MKKLKRPTTEELMQMFPDPTVRNRSLAKSIGRLSGEIWNWKWRNGMFAIVLAFSLSACAGSKVKIGACYKNVCGNLEVER